MATAEIESWLSAAVTAARSGARQQAVDLLLQVIAADEQNEQAWSWLAELVESDADRRICLENVLTIIEEVDALEVLNARCVRPADNDSARSLALAHGKLMTAGSDAHIPFELGHCYLEMPPFEDNAQSFLAALASAQPKGEVSPFWPHLASTWAKWRKKVSPVSYGGAIHRS